MPGRCPGGLIPAMSNSSDSSDSPDIPRLEAAFRELNFRMAGVPDYNPVLSVAAAGFRPWQGRWLGVVVLPWAVQLVLLPGPGGEAPAAPGERRTRYFPLGEGNFMGLDLEGYGPVETAPLLASVSGYGSQNEAEQAARVALNALVPPKGTPASADVPPAQPEAVPAQPAVVRPEPTAEPISRRPVSRRDFLRGRLFGR